MAKRETDSTRIKAKLSVALPNFKISVTRSSFAGGHSIGIYIMSGDIKPFVDETKNYANINEYYIDQSDEYTPEMKKVIKKIIEISNEEGNYNGRHNSQYRDIYIGKWDKPYEYIPKPTRSTTSATTTTRAGFDYGEMVEVCKMGWVIYKKTLPNGSLVYNVVKGKKVVPNKTDWDAIRGEIYTQTGFKWAPRSQTFQRWGSIPNEAFTTKMVCDILAKYYPPIDDEPQEPAQEPTPQPTPKSQGWKAFANDMIDKNNEVMLGLDVPTGSSLYEIEPAQKEYVDKMLAYLSTKNYNFNFSDAIDIQVYLDVSNYNVLNNFLSLAGVYGEELKTSYENYYNEEVAKGNEVYSLNPMYFSKKVDSKQNIETKIKGLQLLAKYGNANAQKKINALQLILKYKK
jgi:hypothetical protein